METSRVKTWRPARFTLADSQRKSEGHPDGGNKGLAVCILNQPLEDPERLVRVCRDAYPIVCADGGTDRLVALDLNEEERRCCRVDFICGDMDSIEPATLAKFATEGTEIVKDTDQYSTDFQKSLRQIRTAVRNGENPSENGLDIAVFGGLGGRADQAFSLLHQLYMEGSSSPDDTTIANDIYLIGKESLIFLLEPGHNRIETPIGPQLFTPNVGIIPIGRASVITTQGLEWDVEEWATEFGGQVSTSNHIQSDTVDVFTTERVLFTMEFSSEQA